MSELSYILTLYLTEDFSVKVGRLSISHPSAPSDLINEDSETYA